MQLVNLSNGVVDFHNKAPSTGKLLNVLLSMHNTTFSLFPRRSKQYDAKLPSKRLEALGIPLLISLPKGKPMTSKQYHAKLASKWLGAALGSVLVSLSPYCREA